MGSFGNVNAIQIAAESPFSADAERLLTGAAAELMRRYGRCKAIPIDEVTLPRAAILIARDAARTAVGCAILRPFVESPETTAEVKRMFVDADARGQGVGAALMHALEAQARAFGYATVVLETGIHQPEAIRLYERHGYVRIPCWGEYADNPLSLCYSKSVG